MVFCRLIFAMLLAVDASARPVDFPPTRGSQRTHSVGSLQSFPRFRLHEQTGPSAFFILFGSAPTFRAALSMFQRFSPPIPKRCRSQRARCGGPIHAPHHWRESIFRYYLTRDEAVLRKHGQMLSDAGVMS
jgi:hypothetical protein